MFNSYPPEKKPNSFWTERAYGQNVRTSNQSYVFIQGQSVIIPTSCGPNNGSTNVVEPINGYTEGQCPVAGFTKGGQFTWKR